MADDNGIHQIDADDENNMHLQDDDADDDNSMTLPTRTTKMTCIEHNALGADHQS